MPTYVKDHRGRKLPLTTELLREPRSKTFPKEDIYGITMAEFRRAFRSKDAYARIVQQLPKSSKEVPMTLMVCFLRPLSKTKTSCWGRIGCSLFTYDEWQKIVRVAFGRTKAGA